MSNYSGNLWADEMGIDLEELSHEHPLHPDQLRLKRIINRRAEEYWARERFPARVEDNAAVKIPEATPEPSKKPRVKRAKVGRYEFTEAQLAIARRSLDARGSV